MRGLANQRDIDIELAQFRDVITAGREVLHVDVPERIKHPPPVPAAVARNGPYLHEQPFATLSRSTDPTSSTRARTAQSLIGGPDALDHLDREPRAARPWSVARLRSAAWWLSPSPSRCYWSGMLSLR